MLLFSSLLLLLGNIAWKFRHLPNFNHRHQGLVLLQQPDAVATLSSNGNATFNWKLRSHWLKGLLLRQVSLVINDPGSDSNYMLNPCVTGPTWTEEISYVIVSAQITCDLDIAKT